MDYYNTAPRGLLLLLAFVAAGCCRPPDEQRLDGMKRMQQEVEHLCYYARIYGGLPQPVHIDANGQAMCSWRFSSRVTLDETLDPFRINEKWPSKIYEKWNRGNRRAYCVRDKSRPNGYTDVLALIGPGTAFSEFGTGKGRDILDSEPNAILLIECESDIHWIQPGDIEVESILASSAKTGIGDLRGNYPEGFVIAFADGAVWFVKSTVPAAEINKFLTVDSASQHDREAVLGAYALERISPNYNLAEKFREGKPE